VLFFEGINSISSREVLTRATHFLVPKYFEPVLLSARTVLIHLFVEDVSLIRIQIGKELENR
jgi:hypothetical protein